MHCVNLTDDDGCELQRKAKLRVTIDDTTRLCVGYTHASQVLKHHGVTNISAADLYNKVTPTRPRTRLNKRWPTNVTVAKVV
jgi:hypothetical protein